MIYCQLFQINRKNNYSTLIFSKNERKSQLHEKSYWKQIKRKRELID